MGQFFSELDSLFQLKDSNTVQSPSKDVSDSLSTLYLSCLETASRKYNDLVSSLREGIEYLAESKQSWGQELVSASSNESCSDHANASRAIVHVNVCGEAFLFVLSAIHHRPISLFSL